MHPAATLQRGFRSAGNLGTMWPIEREQQQRFHRLVSQLAADHRIPQETAQQQRTENK
jgi:hypothetical protein